MSHALAGVLALSSLGAFARLGVLARVALFVLGVALLFLAFYDVVLLLRPESAPSDVLGFPPHRNGRSG